MHVYLSPTFIQSITVLYCSCGYSVAAVLRVTNLYTLQKQVGCFDHRVVALVADKLERQWLLEVCFDVED